MLEDGESKEKNIEFMKSLTNNSNIKTEIRGKAEVSKLTEKPEENLDHLMRRSIYNQDLVLYSRVMIKKKKYSFLKN